LKSAKKKLSFYITKTAFSSQSSAISQKRLSKTDEKNPPLVLGLDFVLKAEC
jgi:hypothetical protein